MRRPTAHNIVASPLRWRVGRGKEGGVITVSVLYPNTPGNRFDMTYYMSKHIPMLRQKLGPALKSVAVEQGLGGGEPGSPPPFLAICHLRFDSVDSFQQSFAPHAPAIVGDVPNYTNAPPTVQVSDVRL
jgi:uncharacterized protein (TIGR02118 family)